MLSKLNNANGPRLTKIRIVLALAIAIFTDGLQLLLGPLGWAFIDDAIDVVAMVLTSWVLGFHWLLLPTFVLKLIPLADDLPTWTACVAAVIVLRRREQRKVPPVVVEKPTIEI
ncbi:MAG TPA: hypothetical protein VGN23_01905 [Verrucomicrobiae bacterium]